MQDQNDKDLQLGREVTGVTGLAETASFKSARLIIRTRVFASHQVLDKVNFVRSTDLIVLRISERRFP
jgi:hypothetical protein